MSYLIRRNDLGGEDWPSAEVQDAAHVRVECLNLKTSEGVFSGDPHRRSCIQANMFPTRDYITSPYIVPSFVRNPDPVSSREPDRVEVKRAFHVMQV